MSYPFAYIEKHFMAVGITTYTSLHKIKTGDHSFSVETLFFHDLVANQKFFFRNRPENSLLKRYKKAEPSFHL